MMQIIHGDMSRDLSGRKRKPLPRSRRVEREFKEWKGNEHLRAGESKKYPSAKMPPPRKPSAPPDFDAVKESKNFTVAPAVNKGAYQVIPSTDVKYIGR